VRAALLLAAALLVTSVVWVGIGTSSGPLMLTCAPQLEPGACTAAVDAVMRRGTPALHPLILSAYVAPGSAPGAHELGHRATVTYELAALPTSAEVELYFDQGAHWGGHPDPSETMMSAMALEPLLLAAVIGGIILVIAWRRRAKAGH
jgi:hypothetical protein